MDRRHKETLMGRIYSAINELRVPAKAGRPPKGSSFGSRLATMARSSTRASAPVASALHEIMRARPLPIRVKVCPDSGLHLEVKAAVRLRHGGMAIDLRRNRHAATEYPTLSQARNTPATSGFRGERALGELQPCGAGTSHGPADGLGSNKKTHRNGRLALVRAGRQARVPHGRGACL